MRDKTDSIAKRIGERLQAGEATLAGVAVALPGTAAARMSGAARASDGIARFADDPTFLASKEAAAEAGLAKGFQFFLVLTDRRLLLVRRSAFGRAKEVVLDVGLADVAIRTSPQGQAVTIERTDGRELRLETPKAFKFLPAVYRELPDRLARAKSALA